MWQIYTDFQKKTTRSIWEIVSDQRIQERIEQDNQKKAVLETHTQFGHKDV